MAKNVLILLLFALLTVAGLFIARERPVDNEMKLVASEESAPENLSKEWIGENLDSEIGKEVDARTLLIGVWQSLDDPQSTIVFNDKDEIIDSYGGGAIEEVGTYQLFNESTNLPIDTFERQGGMVLRQTFGEEEYYYEVLKLSVDSLELVFLTGNGSTLRYARVSY